MHTAEIKINVDNREIAGTLYDPNVPEIGRAAILLVHGYLSDQAECTEYAEALVEEISATCLTFDLGGHGESKGDSENSSINDHVEEMRAAYDVLAAQEGVSPKRIGVIGAGFGGYLALKLTRDRDVKSLLMRAPDIFPDIINDLEIEKVPRKDYNTYDINLFRATLSPPPPADILKVMRNFNGPVKLVRSGKDKHNPRFVVPAYLRFAQEGTALTLDAAQYNLNEKHRDIYKGIVREWAHQL